MIPIVETLKIDNTNNIWLLYLIDARSFQDDRDDLLQVYYLTFQLLTIIIIYYPIIP